MLERPEIPLHTNASENDIRKISGGTRSDSGRDCRDTFLGLSKTCAKLGISFWDYLGSRLDIDGRGPVPYLPELVTQTPRNANLSKVPPFFHFKFQRITSVTYGYRSKGDETSVPGRSPSCVSCR